ncbi:phosphotransferase family protein [Streptomyces sp. NPDC003006]
MRPPAPPSTMPPTLGPPRSVVASPTVGITRPTETDVAQWAASLRVHPRTTVAPAVVGTRMGRPVLDHVPGPRLDLRIQDGSEPDGCLAATGRALAVLHGALPPGQHAVTVEAPPWGALPVRLWAGLSPVQRGLVGTFHRDAELRERGRRTRDLLARPAVWCHGDARTNNVVVTSDGLPLLIDWESAGLGQPETDLGLLCSALLMDCLSASPSEHQARPALSAAMTRGAGLVHSALNGYRDGGGQEVDRELLASAVGCGLLARAFMRASMTSRDRIVSALYEIGRGLLLDPARWEVIDGRA